VHEAQLQKLFVGIYTIDFLGPGALMVYQMSDFTNEIISTDGGEDGKEDYSYVLPTKCVQKCGIQGFKYGAPLLPLPSLCHSSLDCFLLILHPDLLL